MIRIVTDNASDITVEEAQKLNLHRIPLETSFDDGVCPMDTEEDYSRFYEKLRASEKLPFTSRPSPEYYRRVFKDAKKAGDEVLVLTLSSGLSSTVESAHIAKEMVEYDKITIIDTHQAVMSQRILAEYAVKLRDEGKSMQEITDAVLDVRHRVVVYGVIGSLVYLKKGGRIPPALAVLGDALGIKPVITVKDKVILAMGKVRGMKAGIAMVHKKIEEEGMDPDFAPCFGYTSDKKMGEDFMRNTMEKYGIQNAKLCQVNGIIGTHLGTDSIGVAYVRKK